MSGTAWRPWVIKCYRSAWVAISALPVTLISPATNETFPPPWTVEALDGGFKIMDSNGQALAYVYGHADPRDAAIANALTLDEARLESRSQRLGNSETHAPC